jgi:hypothetical protein
MVSWVYPNEQRPFFSRTVLILSFLNLTEHFMRAPGVLLLCFTLAACSTADNLVPIKQYVPPLMPKTDAAIAGVAQTGVEYHLVRPMEMSDLRPTDHGPGHFMLCVRALDPKFQRPGYYAVFFDNDVYKGSRQSVIMDACETQQYRPVP